MLSSLFHSFSHFLPYSHTLSHLLCCAFPLLSFPVCLRWLSHFQRRLWFYLGEGSRSQGQAVEGQAQLVVCWLGTSPRKEGKTLQRLCNLMRTPEKASKKKCSLACLPWPEISTVFLPSRQSPCLLLGGYQMQLCYIKCIIVVEISDWKFVFNFSVEIILWSCSTKLQYNHDKVI